MLMQEPSLRPKIANLLHRSMIAEGVGYNQADNF